MRTTAPSTADSIFKGGSFTKTRNWQKKTQKLGLWNLTQPGLSSPEIKVLVRQSMNALSDTQKSVNEMACYEGLSMREIADRTGDSLVNVHRHYYRGLQKLRSLISGGDDKKPGAERGKCA
jgi:DNA-directed RNA polymerase specialized sigma24 family protein